MKQPETATDNNVGCKTPELKSCPFCGNPAWDCITYKIHSQKTRHIVKCTKCNAMMEYRNKQAAVEAWNRRATDENAL